MPLELNPDDEFEATIMQIVEHHRVKKAEYGDEGDSNQNFYDIAEMENVTPLMACDILLAKHQSFLKQWKRRGEATASYVDDAYLDRAVYSILALVLYKREYDADGDR